MKPWLIGIDLDHTLISYERGLRRWAAQLGVPAPEGGSLKDAVRRHCWDSPEGDTAWQRVQADIYGHSIHEAEPAEGAEDFLGWLQQMGIPAIVVSHKSEFAAASPEGPNLREAALQWMDTNGLFAEYTGLSSQKVYFESSRAEKVDRIGELGCTHFIDDLPGVFAEPHFPQSARQVLFSEAKGWRAISAELFNPGNPEFLPVMSRALGCDLETVTRLTGGRNSSVWLATAGNGEQYVLKHYQDLERWACEGPALAYFDTLQMDCTPHYICEAYLPDILAFEYIDGCSPLHNIGAEDVDAAVAFVALTNAPGPYYRKWPYNAREAEFSFQGVAQQISKRLTALLNTEEQSDLYSQMKSFCSGNINSLLRELTHQAGELMVNEVLMEHRILSPSDFGFHNAIRRPDGSLVFIDFEYFGWDDPAKLVSDFLWHPAMQLSEAHKQQFASGIARALNNHALLAQRLPVAYPLYGVKWCTILLNEFLPEHWARRTFAGDTRPRETVLAEQLHKARTLAARIADLKGGFPYEA